LRGLKKGLDAGKTHKPQQGMGAFQARLRLPVPARAPGA